MSYKNTFIRVSPDCPADRGIEPVSTRPAKPAHMIQYELLSQAPYRYNHEELLFEVHIRHKQIPKEVVQERGQELWEELFSKPHPCLRASVLPKKYGWGVHYDEQGKIAIYGMESPDYQRFTASTDIQLLNAMRNSRK
ncbi:DUF6157 family protein [Paenibacillus timonensis]|uniref:DUF6157 family protein n=1 Tax=Paenibacillus timonensis TaxID=225915 RepID=UPI003F976F0E